MQRSRRRSPYGAYLCAVIAAVLLLLSVSLLYSRLSRSHPHSNHLPRPSLLSDSAELSGADDPIDELDFIDETQDPPSLRLNPPPYFFDPLAASIRRSFLSPPSSLHQWRADSFLLQSAPDDGCKAAFASDDIPLDDAVRTRAAQVTAVEDALLLKGSPLREGWGDWFDKKSVFLRKDRMFRSNFDVLNPLNNPLLHDPDAVGATGLTRGDRIVQKWWIHEFKKVPFPGTKKVPLNINVLPTVTKLGTERRTLNHNNNNNNNNNIHEFIREDMNSGTNGGNKGVNARAESMKNHIYADGDTWGYYPGLPLRLSFSDFMDAFFRVGKCVTRVFMVWNSPPWMYTVRHQRGLESLLFHHPAACVVVFSETVELDFFKDSFVKDGYKVAVAMPNLDELLKDMPAHVFSSVWFEWRKTKYYSTHYSELIRLAALYKYGGIYLDSDIIVLKPISFLNNSVGMEDHDTGSALNGAVMAFHRRSLFIKECLEEFYMTYDDTSLRGNGADLLMRVARKYLGEENKSVKHLELKVEPSYMFFPISSQNITRYFIAPATETDKAQQDVLLENILHHSLTFHFWNSLTFALIPEPDSLVSRLLNYACIRCLELL
ncbi:Galactosyltransferase protein [Spatholobus suberectus]|nr:Galactosyltransferase protein [Spatholobus suberectus]